MFMQMAVGQVDGRPAAELEKVKNVDVDKSWVLGRDTQMSGAIMGKYAHGIYGILVVLTAAKSVVSGWWTGDMPSTALRPVGN